ncbi:MAG: hypothetical protein ACRDKZ_08640, partial [Actinomycetota bacterium]
RFANGRSNIAQIASDVGPTPEEGRRLIHEMLAEGILAVLDDSEFSEYRDVWDARSDDTSGASEEPEIAPDSPEAIDASTGATAEGFEEDLAEATPVMAPVAPPSPPGRPPANTGSHQHVKLDRSMLARELSGLFKNGRQSISR